MIKPLWVTTLQGKNKPKTETKNSKTGHYYTVLFSFYLMYFGARIWEIVDVWVLPSDIKAVRNRLQIQPMFFAKSRQQPPSFGLQVLYLF